MSSSGLDPNIYVPPNRNDIELIQRSRAIVADLVGATVIAAEAAVAFNYTGNLKSVAIGAMAGFGAILDILHITHKSSAD